MYEVYSNILNLAAKDRMHQRWSILDRRST